jgi:hypothetical protein
MHHNKIPNGKITVLHQEEVDVTLNTPGLALGDMAINVGNLHRYSKTHKTILPAVGS